MFLYSCPDAGVKWGPKKGQGLLAKPFGGVGVLPERSDGNLKTVRFLCP
ncbi:hypothetical protein [Methanotorris igneus]|nr:hypothetical protein [Methanotorris igneus]